MANSTRHTLSREDTLVFDSRSNRYQFLLFGYAPDKGNLMTKIPASFQNNSRDAGHGRGAALIRGLSGCMVCIATA